jgi:4'-phosphopantetheinyl transferase EntD
MTKTLKIPFPALSFISQHFTADFTKDELLSPAESIIVSQAVPKRVADFKTGRYCARRALSTLINEQPEILQGKGREPLWPNGITGSISHSSKLTGAIVARQVDVIAVGLDIEQANGIRPDMWTLLFSNEEQELIRSKPDVTFWATLLFSLKESFYKMQYPLTEQFLEFTDIMVAVQDEQLCFSQVNKEYDLSAVAFNNIKAHWTVIDDQLITLCYI